MRVLVTGGAGFVGSHLARELALAGHQVELLDDLSRGHASTVATLGLPFHRADLRDAPAVDAVFAQGRYEAVLHAAAVALVPESVARPELYYDVNVRGGLVLLEAMRRAACLRLVVSSTAAVYGNPDLALIPEDSPWRPTNPYGHTKVAFELAVEAAGRSGLAAVRLRYFNAAGAHPSGDLAERHDPETHLVPRIVQAMKKRETFTIHGGDYEESPDGTCVRDLVHVQDLARAHALALERLEHVAGHAINLGTGRGASVKKVCATAERVLSRSLPLVIGPRRPGDPGRLVAAVEKAERLLGWRARHSLEEIIADAARAQG